MIHSFRKFRGSKKPQTIGTAGRVTALGKVFGKSRNISLYIEREISLLLQQGVLNPSRRTLLQFSLKPSKPQVFSCSSFHFLFIIMSELARFLFICVNTLLFIVQYIFGTFSESKNYLIYIAVVLTYTHFILVVFVKLCCILFFKVNCWFHLCVLCRVKDVLFRTDWLIYFFFPSLASFWDLLFSPGVSQHR